jgi:hypothetical protein
MFHPGDLEAILGALNALRGALKAVVELEPWRTMETHPESIENRGSTLGSQAVLWIRIRSIRHHFTVSGGYSGKLEAHPLRRKNPDMAMFV